MSFIAQIFNFDNIGQKIKGLAKVVCWVCIVLIWIAAGVGIIIGLDMNAPGLLLFIPFAALVLSVLTWIGCWIGPTIKNITSEVKITSLVYSFMPPGPQCGSGRIS